MKYILVTVIYKTKVFTTFQNYDKIPILCFLKTVQLKFEIQHAKLSFYKLLSANVNKIVKDIMYVMCYTKIKINILNY